MSFNHERRLLEMLKALLREDSGICSDVTFQVEDATFKLHRVILAAQSSVFRAMLSRPLPAPTSNSMTTSSFGSSYFIESLPSTFINSGGSGGVIRLPGKKASSFAIFVQYLYSGCLNLTDIKLDNQLELLDLANEYDVSSLFSALSEHFLKNLSTIASSALRIFERAALYYELQPTLYDKCLRCINANADSVLQNDHFVRLPLKIVQFLLSQDEFAVKSEIEILEAIIRWHKVNPLANIVELLQTVRFGCFENDFFLADEINNDSSDSCDIDRQRRQRLVEFLSRHGRPNLFNQQNNIHRIYAPTFNMADMERGAVILQDGHCQNGTAILRNASEGGYASHALDDVDGCFVVRFKRPIVANSMRLILGAKSLKYTICLQCGYEPDMCNCAYSYIVAVSSSSSPILMPEDWHMLADCSQKLCRNSQLIFFHAREISCVKIRGVVNSSRREFSSSTCFCLTRFECPAVDENGEALLVADGLEQSSSTTTDSNGNSGNGDYYNNKSGQNTMIIEQSEWPNHTICKSIVECSYGC